MNQPSTRSIATLSATIGPINIGRLTDEAIEAMAREVDFQVHRGINTYSEYARTYVALIESSSVTPADRLRKLQSYSTILMDQEDRERHRKEQV